MTSTPTQDLLTDVLTELQTVRGILERRSNGPADAARILADLDAAQPDERPTVADLQEVLVDRLRDTTLRGAVQVAREVIDEIAFRFPSVFRDKPAACPECGLYSGHAMDCPVGLARPALDSWAPGTDVTDRLDDAPAGVWVADALGRIYSPVRSRSDARWLVFNDCRLWEPVYRPVLSPVTVATPEQLVAAGITPEQDA